MTAGELVRLTAALCPRSLSAVEAMQRAGVSDVAGKRYGRLSGGQKQWVRFAAALVCDPALLVLDEPTVAMDVQGGPRLHLSEATVRNHLVGDREDGGPHES